MNNIASKIIIAILICFNFSCGVPISKENPNIVICFFPLGVETRAPLKEIKYFLQDSHAIRKYSIPINNELYNQFMNISCNINDSKCNRTYDIRMILKIDSNIIVYNIDDLIDTTKYLTLNKYIYLENCIKSNVIPLKIIQNIYSYRERIIY